MKQDLVRLLLLDIGILLLATVSSKTAHKLIQLYTILKTLTIGILEFISLTAGFIIAMGQSTVRQT